VTAIRVRQLKTATMSGAGTLYMPFGLPVWFTRSSLRLNLK